ncbi:XRE family transcriptional regulator [Streptomyces sp. NPDC048281]|uniref:telomere-protecting terminal protein Tpg n=1 Tax=Streptomyces sp. NPDC048281 TaxID=3154715 RepID=UPI00341AFBA0
MAGEIDDAIERVDRESFTREPPKTLKGQISYLMGQLKTTRAVAAELGVSQRSVERYRKGERKHPPKGIQQKIDAAVRSRWQPQVRKRRQRQAAATGGITVETRARFGYTAPVGTTDDGRFRRLTVHLPPEYARRLFEARAAGASDQQMRGIIAEGFKDVYFQDGGSRAMGLSDVEINDIDYLDLDY